jgi:D-aminopeptidase
VKRPLGRDQCIGLDAVAGRLLVAEKVAEAIELCRAGRLQPFKPKLPMTIAIEMRTIEQADTACKRPGVRRVDDLTIEAEVARQCDVTKWIRDVGLDMPASAA